MLFERGDTPYDLEPHISTLFRSELKVFNEILGPRKLGHNRAPRDLLLYEPRCAVCLRSADDMRSTLDPEYTSLLYCPDCRAAFACTEDHRAEYLDEHSHRFEDGESYTECEMNKRAYEDSLEIVTRGWSLTETLWFPQRRKSEYAPLPTKTGSLSCWDQWFADPSNLCPPESSPVLNRVCTRQLSIPLTVLYGMELFDKAAGDLPLLSSRTELEIAVLGANEYELKFGGLACFEEILHTLPSLRRLTLRLIGPQVPLGLVGLNGLNQELLKPWVPCALCKEKGLELVHSIHAMLFHDYVDEGTTKAAADGGPAFQWPDIAVAFNSGMGLDGGNTSWAPTIETLAKNGVPTLCTSFLERESEEDEEVLMRNQCNIIFKRHKNPWRSELLTKMVFMRKGYFTYNGFVQGFRGWDEREGDSEEDVGSELPMDEEKMMALLKLMMQATLEFNRK